MVCPKMAGVVPRTGRTLTLQHATRVDKGNAGRGGGGGANGNYDINKLRIRRPTSGNRHLQAGFLRDEAFTVVVASRDTPPEKKSYRFCLYQHR